MKICRKVNLNYLFCWSKLLNKTPLARLCNDGCSIVASMNLFCLVHGLLERQKVYKPWKFYRKDSGALWFFFFFNTKFSCSFFFIFIPNTNSPAHLFHRVPAHAGCRSASASRWTKPVGQSCASCRNDLTMRSLRNSSNSSPTSDRTTSLRRRPRNGNSGRIPAQCGWFSFSVLWPKMFRIMWLFRLVHWRELLLCGSFSWFLTGLISSVFFSS